MPSVSTTAVHSSLKSLDLAFRFSGSLLCLLCILSSLFFLSSKEVPRYMQPRKEKPAVFLPGKFALPAANASSSPEADRLGQSPVGTVDQSNLSANGVRPRSHAGRRSPQHGRVSPQTITLVPPPDTELAGKPSAKISVYQSGSSTHGSGLIEATTQDILAELARVAPRAQTKTHAQAKAQPASQSLSLSLPQSLLDSSSGLSPPHTPSSPITPITPVSPAPIRPPHPPQHTAEHIITPTPHATHPTPLAVSHTAPVPPQTKHKPQSNSIDDSLSLSSFLSDIA